MFPKWIGVSETFWYERYSKAGREYRLVNARKRTNTVAFDHGRLAEALSDVSGENLDPKDLPITEVDFALEPLTLTFRAFEKFWTYNDDLGRIAESAAPNEAEVVSPDGDHAVFAKGYNLWLRHIASGDEKQLTFDGEEFFCYGAAGRAWGALMADEGKLQVVWSSDSKRILTVQRDSRHVKSLPVLHNLPKDGSIRPTVEHVKVAFPGDEHVEGYKIVAIDVSSGKTTSAAYENVPAIRNSGGFISDRLGWWHDNGEVAYFIYVDRYYKSAKLIEFNVTTGATRPLFEETADTQLQLSDNADENPSIIPLPETNELIWYSNRSGWGHLYLYSTEDGTLKRMVTSGDWVVRDIIHYDRERREIFLQTSSRKSGAHPHHKDFIKVHIETGEITELAAGEHTYFAARDKSIIAFLASSFGAMPKGSNAVSPTGNYFVVSRSRLSERPQSLLFDTVGTEIMSLETADLTGLPENWRWPERVKVLSDDGTTEVYGCMYRPSTFSEDNSYPVLNQVFNTPELSWIPEGSLACDGMFGYSFFIGAALAELGFIVVQFAGRGTTGRSKKFLDHSYGRLEDASDLADHVAGLKQLAEKHPYMDMERVGIISDQGGPGGALGLLEFPDFYKVGVASIVHDSRVMSGPMWGDKFEGPDANDRQELSEEKLNQLCGRLLIIHGMLDTISPPVGAFRLIEALKRANKNFDMLVLPCLGHGMSNYVTRRSWDYLATHLMGEEPPYEYPLKGFQWSN